MPVNPLAIRRGLPFLALTISLAAQLAFVSLGAGRMEPVASESIEQLIQRLDASRFSDREVATVQLAELGGAAIQPVALHFLEASPEAAWRIKRVLEQIATGADDEETSLKAIAILIVLDHQLDDSLASLLDMWRENRSKRAIDDLVSKGATVQVFGINQFGMRQPNVIWIREFNVNQKPAEQADSADARAPKLTESEIRKEIERLVAGDMAEVQRLVFSHLPDADSDVNQQQWENGRLGVRLGAFDGAGQIFGGNLLEFGEAWRGNSDDLARVAEVRSLYGIRFQNQTLTQSDIDSISNLGNLRYFGMENTDFRGSSISKLKLPESVSNIEFARQDIDTPTVRWLASRPVSHLILDDCKIAPAASTGLSDLSTVTNLELRRIPIDRILWQQLGKLPGLNLVQLSVCKFELDDYREFVSENGPRPVIRFNPVAFLGVQALSNGREVNTWSCQVEMVVAGSGADRAGLKTGDIIEAVNGNPISIFEELRMYISQRDIGDAMDLQVLRGEERLELTATLGENPNNSGR